jgi:ribonuclease Y
MPQLSYAYVAIGALIAGYILFLILLKFFLPRKLRAENLAQRQLRLKQSKQKFDSFASEEYERTTQQLESLAEDLEATISDRTHDLETVEQELESQEEQIAHEEARLERLAKENETHVAKAEKIKSEFVEIKTQVEAVQKELRVKLETVANHNAEKLKQNLSEEMINSRQLESTKHLRLLADELNITSNKLATRILDSAHARYAPDFFWPKGINHVEVLDRKTAEVLGSDTCTLLTELRELSEDVTINFVAEPGSQAVVRLVGGYGIYKEAAKLALDELIPRGPSAWNKLKPVYEKHKIALENQALRLGKNAIRDLHLKGMAPEIMKMIGALNWRTSYRQNQYYHSVEVAKLAGVLANELGVDPDMAKRCGLLHDIGKGIDYRIEGSSHAVISGDYADRYGENKIVCDAVMSHHADLLIETPLAYTLRAADTLSGARPGARVNLEEGYQDRLSSIVDVVKAFPGVTKVEIMNGAREVHVEVNHKRVKEEDLQSLSSSIARRIEENVAYPGQIKVMVARRFEAVAVA